MQGVAFSGPSWIFGLRGLAFVRFGIFRGCRGGALQGFVCLTPSPHIANSDQDIFVLKGGGSNLLQWRIPSQASRTKQVYYSSRSRYWHNFHHHHRHPIIIIITSIIIIVFFFFIDIIMASSWTSSSQ